MLRVRAVDGTDLKYAALLQWLQLEALPGDTPLETSEGNWWVAFDGSQPVAFAGLIESQQYPKSGYLCRAGVLPSHRGRGLQTRLIAVRERKARSLGWNSLVTDTYDNPPSSNNLIKAGFRMHTPIVRYAAEGTCYWRKPLCNPTNP
jgi:GNAT superfamily N-acetyltransferase